MTDDLARKMYLAEIATVREHLGEQEQTAPLREIAAQAIRDAACTGNCGETEEECAKERIQSFAWRHGVLAVVEGSPEQLAAAVLAAVLPTPVDRAAVLREAAEALEARRCSPESVDVVLRLIDERLCDACKGYGQTATPTEDGGFVRRCRDCDGKGLRRMADEGPLSPYYEHPECGFHWHGRDGMDVPMRDGQPVCPRCELRRVADETAATETQAAALSPAERTMLDYALDQAQERIWSDDGFTAEDQAAVDSLRRLTAKQPAAGARQDGARP